MGKRGGKRKAMLKKLNTERAPTKKTDRGLAKKAKRRALRSPHTPHPQHHHDILRAVRVFAETHVYGSSCRW